MKKQLTIILIFISMFTYAENDKKREKTDAMLFGDIKVGKHHIPFATIQIVGTNLGAVANATGHFVLSHLPVGNQIVKVSAVGYFTKEVSVTMVRNKSTELFVELKEDVLNLEQVVVTANRNKISRKDAAVVVNVISPKIFKSVNAVTLADGLNYQPGLRMENNCNNCGFAQVRMNGLEGPYTQILIDSKAVFSSLNGVYGLEQIPVNMIERVEIIRGGGSALFGGNAIAGTINIITKDPINNSYSISNNTSLIRMKALETVTNFNTSLVSEDKKSGVAIFGMYRDRESYNANPDDTFEYNGKTYKDDFSEIAMIKNKSFGFRAYHKPSRLSKISLDFSNINEHRRGGDNLDLPSHEALISEEVKHDILTYSLGYKIWSDDNINKFDIYTSGQKTERNAYYGAEKQQDGYGLTYDFTQVYGANYVRHFDKLLFTKATLTTGVEYSMNSLEDNKIVPGEEKYLTIIDEKVTTAGFFVQNEWNWDNVKLLLGARADKNSVLDDPVFCPRANVLFNLPAKTQLRLSYGKGFRAPQIFSEDLHIAIAGAKTIEHKQDENLVEEESHSFTASIDNNFTIGEEIQAYILAEGFYTKLENPFRNEFETDDHDHLFTKRVNASGARVFGMNFETKFSYTEYFDFQMGLTIQRSEYSDSEEIWAPNTEDLKFATVNSKTLPVSYMTDTYVRSPNVYGYFVANFKPTRQIKIALSGNYTGKMNVPHVQTKMIPYIDNGDSKEYELIYSKEEKSDSFIELGLKASYNFYISRETQIEVTGGVQNILDSYQSDFDTGVTRDAAYVYGPLKPRTFFVGIKIGNIL